MMLRPSSRGCIQIQALVSPSNSHRRENIIISRRWQTGSSESVSPAHSGLKILDTSPSAVTRFGSEIIIKNRAHAPIRSHAQRGEQGTFMWRLSQSSARKAVAYTLTMYSLTEALWRALVKHVASRGASFLRQVEQRTDEIFSRRLVTRIASFTLPASPSAALDSCTGTQHRSALWN